jgi:hypothetical protein
MDFKMISGGITAVTAFVAALYGGAHWHNTNFAWQEYVDSRFEEHVILIMMNDNRISQSMASDEIVKTRERLYQLEDRYGGIGVPKAPVSVQEEYRALQEKKDDAKKKLKSLEKEQLKMERDIKSGQ